VGDATTGVNGREDLLVRLDGAVQWVTLNRPAVRNALTVDQRRALVGVLEAASEDPTVRVVVLRGSGGSFCGGADLRAGGGWPARPPEVPERVIGDIGRRLVQGAQRLIEAVLACDKPVIAMVEGVAAGMGVQLALACDMVVAADNARFIEVYVRQAILPDAGAVYLLTRLIGPQKAKQLLFFGDAVSAPEALAMGLINEVVAPAELGDRVDYWAQRLASGPTRTLALTKALVNAALDRDRGACLADEAIAQDLNMLSHDAQEGLAAFVERRSVNYRGW
jgi:2-(1,2-epoxy-1,2-dihydrophenyl)acetyl-CoA isomerase